MLPSGSFILYGKNKTLTKEVAYSISLKFLGKQNEIYIKNNVYQDFLLVDGEITVEKVRAIIGFFNSTSEFGGYKIALIEANNINKNAANAILKILEEPPLKALILLTTNRLYSLIPTIRSRCQKIFIKSQNENNFNQNSKFLQNCLAFFNKEENIPLNFIKTIKEEEIPIFLNFSLYYSYLKCLTTQKIEDSQRYLQLNKLIEKSRNTYLDQQTLIAACYMLI